MRLASQLRHFAEMRIVRNMHSQTHVIMGAALFGGKVPKRAWFGALGGILPDLPMLFIVLALKLAAVPDPVIFGFLYWQDWWQITNAVAHNFWGWGAVFAIALVLRERAAATAQTIDRCSLALVLSGSALLHCLIDFLVHREDAHMSFWPVTRWKFISPVSYYDPAHFGHYFSIFEALVGLSLAALLLSRFRSRWVRGALILAIFLYLAVPAYFILL
jgi:hypothetical protein